MMTVIIRDEDQELFQPLKNMDTEESRNNELGRQIQPKKVRANERLRVKIQ